MVEVYGWTDANAYRCKKDQDMVMMVMVIFAGVPT